MVLQSALLLSALFAQASATDESERVPFTINGKKMTAEKVRLGAKIYVPQLIAKPNVNVTGKLTKIEGLWWEPSEESKGFGVVKIAPKVQGRKPEIVLIDTDVVFPDFTLRNDVKVTIYGPVQSAGYIQAWLIDVAPPGLQWACQVQDPGVLTPGQDQTFMVDIVIKNTGQQLFTSVTGVCRIWQKESPNDVTDKVVIENLLPGETRKIQVPITFFNYRVIGKTSVPFCAFTVTTFE